MLSTSRPAQKNFSEEDSSGSDAGSEVGLETDRFGFLLANGCTAGSVGPPPELVRQREAKWINIIGQWERILSKKTSKVKVQCQKGIPASLRAKCWPLLCGATDRMKQNEHHYQFLDSQPALQNWVDVIERDLDRQFPFHEMFLSKDGHGQRGLFRVLKAYTQYQPEEGYCQAQGPVAAVLLMNMPAEEAFWCLVQISEQYLPGYYSPLLEGVLFDAAMLTWVLKRTCPAAHKHLQHHGVEPLMFATDWLMCLFTRHLPFNTLLRVWDLFFCYGVRVLLQVAVVLVRRVLGRAEQRKECQGQMETLERLRGVREHIQEEEDTFIAEVCSVPLSARDLERQTGKALEKWRKDRPQSTFDPRGRCQGYQMAWARARNNEEERDRKEREKGNLSVPLARSVSTLSLSPSLLHKWRKGGKVNAGEWSGGGRVVRHLSMGAKEDWGSFTELSFKKEQGVQEEEDVVSEEHKKQSKLKLTGQTEQKELLEEPKKMDKQNIATQPVEETERVPVKPQIEQMEKKEIQQRGTEERTVNSVEEDTTQSPNTPQPAEHTSEQQEQLDSNIQSQVLLQEIEGKDTTEETERQVEEGEHTAAVEEEDTTVETEANQNPAEAQFVENIPQPAKQEDQVDSNIQSQVLLQEIEGKDTTEETEKQVEEREHTAAVEENQTEVQKDVVTNTDVKIQVELRTQADMKHEERTETENVQQTELDMVTEVRVEAELQTRPDNRVDGDVETQTVKNPDQTLETETQQQQQDTGTDSQEGAFEVEYHSSDSLAEIGMKEESHTQTETEINVLTDTQEKEDTQEQLVADVHTDSEQHDARLLNETETEKETTTLPSPECIHDKENADRAESEAEIPDADETVTSEVFAQSLEEESKTTDNNGSEPTRDKEEMILAVHSEEHIDNDLCDQTQVEETATESNVSADETTQLVLNLTAEKAGLDQISAAVGQPASEEPKSQVTMGPVEEEKSTEDLQEDSEGEDCVFISSQQTDQTEPSDNDAKQASRHGSSRSSGDICVRKSSSSHGSRLARRLSEDLFVSPQKTNQSIPSQPDQVKNIESQSNPGALNPTTPAPDVSHPSTEAAAAQQELGPHETPKRFGLFRRMRGEQPKKNKAKGTPKIQVPKILIQDFSDGRATGKPVEEEENLSSRERRKRRRERERREKEEERLRKKREKELEKERERERKKPQTRGKSFQVSREKGSTDEPASTGSQTLKYSAYAESYF